MCNEQPMSPEETKDRKIQQDKGWRAQLDAILRDLKYWTRWGPGCRISRERCLAITKIEEAIMWLDMDLKEINNGVTRHPEGCNPGSDVVHPVADGLKR